MKDDAERNEIRKRLKKEQKKYRGNDVYSSTGIVFLIMALLIVCSNSSDAATVMVGLFFIALGGFLVYYPIYQLNQAVEREMQRKKEQEEQRKQQVEQEEQRKQQNQRGNDHSWSFPAEEFYNMCAKENTTDLSMEFSFIKATNYAKQLIERENPLADMSAFKDYLEKEKLQSFLETGKSQAEQTAKKKLEESKQVRKANADSNEATFMQRSSAVAGMTGCQKRVQMLTDLIGDYDREIQKLKDGEEAMKQLAMMYAGAQKKESDWAILGGAANGIAGPVASAAVIWDTMKKNGEIAKYNEGMRKASRDVLSGTVSVAGNRIKVEQERDNVKARLEEAKGKVTLSKPDANEIWNNIHISPNYSVKRYDSGVLKVSISLDFLRSFALNIPQDVHMVVDGTIRAYVTMDGIDIGTVEFPLPLYGIPCDADAKVTLDGMCGWSTEFQGKYSLRFADQQNLWIMEA